MMIVYCLLVIAVCIGAAHGNEWGYDKDNGPATWGKAYSDCNGAQQSPIDLPRATRDVKFSKLLKWVNFDEQPLSMTLNNNGHTVVLNGVWLENKRPAIITTEDNKVYRLDSMHFHWGKNNNDGTEHAIGGEKGALEQHTVFRLVGDNSSVLVYGALYKENYYAPQEDPMNKISPNLKVVTTSPSEVSISPYPLGALLPWADSPWAVSTTYHYSGSLTTPACSYPVKWFVNGDFNSVSKKTMDAFRKIKNAHGERMLGNIRPLQPVNSRAILMSFSQTYW